MKSSRLCGVLVGFSLCLGLGREAAANSPLWGAITYSESTGIVGWAWAYASQEIAEAVALRKCKDAGANDCYVAINVSGGRCAALARGDNRGAGWSRGNSVAEAERNALVYCSQRTTNCQVINQGCQ